MIKIEKISDYHSTCGVYAIKNFVSNKWYFGSAIVGNRPDSGIGCRLQNHLSALRRGAHHNRHLQSSWNKHGESAFELYLVEECNNDNIRVKEQEWITNEEFDVYNMTFDTIAPFLNRKHTEETKALISQNRKGITAGEKHHLYGVGHTEMAKKKMSESHKLLTGEKNPFYGKEHTEEAKEKIRLTKLKKPPKPGRYKGVNLQGKKYVAYVYINRKQKILGRFADPIEAAKVYDAYAKANFPEGIYLNFPIITTGTHV